MKILTIPDLHGSPLWKQLIKEPHDLAVFLGDYMDSFDISVEDQIGNLQDIIMYKKENPDRTKLLLGNHDIQYLYYPHYRCSGFNKEKYGIIQQIFYTEQDLFNIAYQPNKEWIFTHAGIGLSWYRKHLDTLQFYAMELNVNLIDSLDEVLNYINDTDSQEILHEVGQRRGGMRYDYGGPTWADLSELRKGILPYKHQVVGHNHLDSWYVIDGPNPKSTSCTLIDCLTYGKQELRLAKEFQIDEERNKPFVIEID